MKKTSKCLLFALSCLGSMGLNSLASFAIGNIPPFGQMFGVSDDSTVYVDPGAAREDNFLGAETNEDGVYVMDHDMGALSPEPSQEIENHDEKVSSPKQSGVVVAVPVKTESAVSNVNSTPELKESMIPVVKQADDIKAPSAQIQKEAVLDAPMPRKDAVENVKIALTPAAQEQIKDMVNSVTDALQKVNYKNSGTVGSVNPMVTQVVRSLLNHSAKVVAYTKAKNAYMFVKEAEAFGLPHRSYLDITLLPQFEEVKMFTQLLCGMFDIEVPSEAAMVENYKKELPNLIVMNKYLPAILKDIYEVEQAQKQGTYEFDLTDLNFVNRLVISATSNSKDDSSTLPGSKLRGAMPTITPEERGFAKGMFGKRIGNTISSEKNKDHCAKTIVKKVKNGEIQGRDYF
jgi:hypothetical protein